MIATASVLLTTIMGISRIVFAMARNNDLPAFLSSISPRFSTPHYAIWITGALMIGAILLADLSLVVAVSTFAMLISYFIANISALRLPRKYQRYPLVVPVIGAITCTGLVGLPQYQLMDYRNYWPCNWVSMVCDTPENHEINAVSCHQLFYYSPLDKSDTRNLMKRITVNALVDIGCLITFIPSLVSGLVLYLVLP